VCLNGRELRLDLAYPKHRVCIEYDGAEFHTSPAQRIHDEDRRALLRQHGWTVIVVTKADLDRDAISRWTGEIRAALMGR
jgi:very-short-patch-repair endonuclease